MIMSCCLQGEQTCLESQEDIFMEVSILLEGPTKPRREGEDHYCL